MHILVKFPSRGRPEKLRSTYLKYISMADYPANLSFLISLDHDDTTHTPTNRSLLEKFHPNCTIVIGDSVGKIGAVNRDMDKAGPFDILLLASDDMIPIVKGYDTIIRNNMKTLYPDTDGVLFFNDGYRQRNLNTLCILGKKYYDRFGYIYYPGYKSFWCDNEFMEVADLLNKQTYFADVIIKHEHPLWTGEVFDETYSRNEIIGEHVDKNLYYKRKSNNFGVVLI